MTDDELMEAGKELAEACRLASVDIHSWRGSKRYWLDPLGWATPTFLTENEYIIRRNCYPVLDSRFGLGKWELGINYVSGGVSEAIFYLPEGRIAEARHASLPYALNRAIMAALTVGK